MLTSLAVIGLSGCGVRENGNLSYDLLYDGNYKFIIYDNITNNEKTYELIDDLDKKQVMLVYEYYDAFENEIGMWKPDGKRFLLTNMYYTSEEAWDEFNQRYNILEEIEALPLLISEFGPKDEYTKDDIQQVINMLELSLDEKAKKLRK